MTHIPTQENRELVTDLTSFGNTQLEIAQVLDIHLETLTKHYDKELKTAVALRNGVVARSLYRKAVHGDDLQAQIFWLKTRARWRTTDPVQLEAIEATIDAIEARKEAIKKAEKDY